jgi:hypothetical protein
MPARPWLIPLIAASAVAGCSGGASCYELTQFSSNPNTPSGINVSGFDAFDCHVTFTAQGRSPVIITLKAPGPSTTAPAPDGPTVSDTAACPGSGRADAQLCTQTSGPAYTSCARSPTCLWVAYSNAEATRMATFLGGNGNYEVQVECAGVVVGNSTSVPSRVQQCAL